MYAKVKRDMYQKVTGFARAAIQIGRFTASVMGQIIVSYHLMNLKELHYITLGGTFIKNLFIYSFIVKKLIHVIKFKKISAQSVSLVFALALPAVGTSLYFYSAPKTKEVSINTHAIRSSEDLVDFNEKPKFSLSRALNLMARHLKEAYTNPTVIEWSFW